MREEGKMKPALEGVKVADFSWILAGPLSTKYLADHGATVIKIESAQAPDMTRTMAPYRDGIPGLNRAGLAAIVNTSKLSLSLDLNHPRFPEMLSRLIEWADIAVEGFAPGQAARWGLTYENLTRIRPDIIMLSTSMQGQTGPYARQPGFGFLVNSLAGFTDLTGWPDREPAGPAIPYTDVTAPWFETVALLAALDYRRRTGQGQYIDVSQLEAGLSFLRVPLLDYAANGRVQERQGNRSPCAAPHGVYRCRGDDRWCAIAVFTQTQWHAFCEVLGQPAWCRKPAFATLSERLKHQDELDRLVEGWTREREAEEVAELMQARGVPAGVVQNARDIMERDPQVEHRGWARRLSHPELGEYRDMGSPAQLSRTPAQPRPAPCLGEHTGYVCTRLLEMPDAEFVALLNEGLFGGTG